MTVRSGTVAGHVELYDELRDFLTDAPAGGLGWTELDSDATSFIVQAPGLSTTEEIQMGFGIIEDDDADAYSMEEWMFRAYNPLLGFQSQPGISTIGNHPLWNDSIPYWFIGNAQRIIIVTKISTVYTASYIGKILPYGTPGEWPQPYYRGGVGTDNTRWSSVSESLRNFWDPGGVSGQSQMLNPNGNWYNVNNFTDSSGAENASNSTNYMWPYSARVSNVGTASPMDRYRELRDNLDGSRSLWPVVLCGENPNLDIYGELDGVYAVSGFSAASEDTVDIGGDDYLIVQNVFRTARYQYAAIKLV